MKCIWLGQAGLLFDFNGFIILVDPYFSDSAAEKNNTGKRRVQPDMGFLDVKPDVLVLTHDHLDHADPETLDYILHKWNSICVLASKNAWQRVRQYGGGHNYVLFDRKTEWTQGPVRFCAVHAQHSDSHAIGFVIDYKEKVFYITGDTLYHHLVIEDIKALNKRIDAVFLPVNGVGNNLNMCDAARFAKEIDAIKVVPVHFGMYDTILPEKDFHCENMIVPSVYREICL